MSFSVPLMGRSPIRANTLVRARWGNRISTTSVTLTIQGHIRRKSAMANGRRSGAGNGLTWAEGVFGTRICTDDPFGTHSLTLRRWNAPVGDLLEPTVRTPWGDHR